MIAMIAMIAITGIIAIIAIIAIIIIIISYNRAVCCYICMISSFDRYISSNTAK